MVHSLIHRLEDRVLLAATPVLVADLNTSGRSSWPAEFTVFNHALYFTAYDEQHGRALWRWDGSQATLAASITAGEGFWSGLRPEELTVFNGALYFRAFSPASGMELWKYDGTSATLAADIKPNNSPDPQSNGSGPSGLKVIGDKLYFAAEGDYVSGREIWSFDGTTATRLADLNPGKGNSEPFTDTYDFTLFNGAVYFIANAGDNINRLFRYDGQNIERVDQAVGGPHIAFLGDEGELTVFDGALYFSGGLDADYIDRELWSFDGVSITRVADIWPGGQGSRPRGLYVYKNALYFGAVNGPDSGGLFKFDGNSATLAGAVAWQQSELGIEKDVTLLNGDLYFSSGGHLWKFDGASETQVSEVAVGLNKAAFATAAFGDFIYLSAESHATGIELARYNGDSVDVIVDVQPGTEKSYPRNFSEFDGKLYFTADSDQSSHDELWVYDGSSARIADPTRQYFQPNTLVELNGKLYFTAANANDVGWDLWRYDGDHSTKVLGDDNGWNFYPPGAISFGGMLLLRGYSYETGGGDGVDLPADGLWAFDGTEATLIGPGMWVPEYFGAPLRYAILNGAIYFLAGSAFDGTMQLWKFDDNTLTPAPGIAPASLTLLGDMKVYDGAIYFGATADPNTEGYELWKYDGAQATLAAEIRAGSEGSNPSGFENHDGSLYFAASGDQFGYQLWKYNATTGASQMTSTLMAGPSNLASLAGVLYFFASDEPTFFGNLWSYDGVEAREVAELVNPSGFGRFNGALYFSADDGLHGSELWKLEPDVPVGDLNRDGTVSIADFVTLSANFGKGNVGWSGGDLNYDNQVSISDFIDLSANFGKSTIQPAEAESEEREEPVHAAQSSVSNQPVKKPAAELNRKKPSLRVRSLARARRHSHHHARRHI